MELLLAAILAQSPPTQTADPQARPRPVPVLLVAGLSSLAVGIAGQTIDVIVSEPGNANQQGLVGLAMVPLVGSALFAFSSFRAQPLSAFGARAFAWLGVQTVGAVLSLLWGFVDDDPSPVSLSLGPVSGGAVLGFSGRL